MAVDETVIDITPGHEGPVQVPLMSPDFGKLVSQRTETGNLELTNFGQDLSDTAHELHKGSMKNVEAALNAEIKAHPGVSFYLLRCLRRDFVALTTFFEVIQSRPMEAPVPETPGMTLFHWDHVKQQLFLLWSLPPEPVMQLALHDSRADDMQRRVRDFIMRRDLLKK